MSATRGTCPRSQTVWHTAAPIPPSLKQFWIDWLSPEHIWEMYGGTEGFATTQLNGAEWLAHRGSVGRPAGCEILIQGEDGAALPVGEVGEIFMRRDGADPEQPGYRYVGARSGGWATGSKASAISAGWTGTATSISPTAAPT